MICFPILTQLYSSVADVVFLPHETKRASDHLAGEKIQKFIHIRTTDRMFCIHLADLWLLQELEYVWLVQHLLDQLGNDNQSLREKIDGWSMRGRLGKGDKVKFKSVNLSRYYLCEWGDEHLDSGSTP